MVQFGQYIQQHRISGWEDYYINYKKLKTLISDYEDKARLASDIEVEQITKQFSDMLDSQVEKTVLWYLEKQGQLAGEMQRLRLAQDSIEDRAQLLEAQEAYRNAGREMVKLLEFVELNESALRKILKKFDRRVGYHLGEQYIATRGNHPYSHVQQFFRPVGVGALTGTLVRNLRSLKERIAQSGSISRTSSFLLYRDPGLADQVAEEEPVVKQIRQAQERLSSNVSYNSFLGHALLLPPVKRMLPGQPEPEEVEFHWWSLQLNQANTFLYMVNYYIIVPSSDDYAVALNAPSTLCGVIIGCTPLFALMAAWVYSRWSNRSYNVPLVVSTLVLVAGNLLYALALDVNSVWLLLIGRCLSGAGSARAINRRYIADHVPLSRRTADSAAFVSASALGMAAGPFIAGITGSIAFKVGGFHVNYLTSPGWLMSVAWLVYLCALLVLFKEPRHVALADGHDTSAGKQAAAEKPDLEKSLLDHSSGASHRSQDDGSEAYDEDDEVGRVKTVTTWRELRKELTVPVLIMLYVYFMVKFAAEVLVSESSVVTKFYFGWTIKQVGWFLALLGATVLPVSAVVGKYVSSIFEERLVIFWTSAIMGLGVLANMSFRPWLPYSHTQYVGSALVIFVTSNVIEGVNMALLSKVMSPKLASGTYNCGFLSTEAGTFARVVGDGLISAAGLIGSGYLLNVSQLPVLIVTISALFLLRAYYRTLY